MNDNDHRITAMLRTRNHRGQTIRECERIAGEHDGLWLVQAYHSPTGMPYSDETCPHFVSIREARRHIDTVLALSQEEIR